MRRRHSFSVAIAVVTAFVLYPLSWGPFTWLLTSGKIPDGMVWCDHCYNPLRYILDGSPERLRNIGSGYLQWWESRVSMPYYDPKTDAWEE
jgi:hypothetical protein